MSYQVTFTLADAYGRQTRKTFVSDRAAAADVSTDTAAMITLLEAVSELAVVSTQESLATVYSTSPEALSNVDSGATLHIRLDNGKLCPLKIPGVEVGLINSDGSVKVDEAAITELVSAFKSTGHWKLSETNRAVSIVGGELDR
jgi:hypothetical protein